MAGSSEQAERTKAYNTLRKLLWLWQASDRLKLLTELVERCPLPNVVALLVHRLKEEHLAEAQPPKPGSEGSASGSGPAIFTAAAVLDVVEPLLVVPTGDRHAADPLDSLDAWMAALNLVRLLLTRAKPKEPEGGASSSEAPAAPLSAGAALPAARVATLRRERLEPLDTWVRARMDALWGEVQRAEAQTPPPSGLDQMRMSFTHLHVAADVAARTVECAKW